MIIPCLLQSRNKQKSSFWFFTRARKAISSCCGQTIHEKLVVCLLSCLLLVPLAAQAGSEAMQPLQKYLDSWQGNLHFDTLTGIGRIVAGSDLISFKVDQPSVLLGGSTLLNTNPLKLIQNSIHISSAAAFAIQEWLDLRRAERAAKTSVAVILIDPGHGGRDPGAIGEHGSGANKFRVMEKDVTLAIGLELYSQLKQRWPDKTILITRSDDSFPTLEDRVTMANGYDLSVNEAVIYISIHANASFNTKAKGFEVWYLNPEYRRTVVAGKKAEGIDKDVLPIINTMLEEEYTTESIFLARSILDGLQSNVGDQTSNRGIRAEEWFVVRNARMPSVLVEVGFVTNEEEAKLLTSEPYLQKLTKGIYNGVVSFVDYFEVRRGLSQP